MRRELFEVELDEFEAAKHVIERVSYVIDALRYEIIFDVAHLGVFEKLMHQPLEY